MTQQTMNEKVSQIQLNLEHIMERIARAAEKSARKPEAVKLVAVTKLMDIEVIRAGIQAGLRCFGENYAEQAAEKINALETDEDIEWHMIGHIQSRKADTVCEHFDMVHSLDRIKIARYLDRNSAELNKIMPVLIEVNLSGEGSKYGWQASDEVDWPDLVPQFRQIADLAHLEIRGLMSMPPLFDDPELTRPIYQRLRRVQEFLKEHISTVKWGELSIGTSFDYEVAIEEGATMVRIGTEIFGSRPGK